MLRLFWQEASVKEFSSTGLLHIVACYQMSSSLLKDHKCRTKANI